MKSRTIWIAWLVLMTAAFEVHAAASLLSIEDLPLRRLAADSDIVVVAHVDSIATNDAGERLATATVVERWKNSLFGCGSTVVFRASPTWLCDSSNAELGETDLLFLGSSDLHFVRPISNSGQGRFPIRTQGPRREVDVSVHEIRLLPELPIDDSFEPPSPSIRRIDLAVLKDLLFPPPHHALSLEELVRRADWVGVVRFTERIETEDRLPTREIWSVSPIATWKGAATSRLKLRLRPTPPNDVNPIATDAIAIVFLRAEDADGIRVLADLGAGRLPVRATEPPDGSRDSRIVYLSTTDCELPRSIALAPPPTTAGQVPVPRDLAVAREADVERAIRAALTPTATASRDGDRGVDPRNPQIDSLPCPGPAPFRWIVRHE